MPKSFDPVVSTRAFSNSIALSSRVNSPTDFFVLLNRYGKRVPGVRCRVSRELRTPALLADCVVAAGDCPVNFGAFVFPLSSGGEGWGEEALAGGAAVRAFAFSASHLSPNCQKYAAATKNSTLRHSQNKGRQRIQK